MAETGSGEQFKVVQDLMHEMIAMWQRVKDLEDADRANRLAIETLRANEARLRCILEKLPLRFFFKDAGLHYVLCSEAYARDWDMPAGELAGKADRDLFAAETAEKLSDVEFDVIRTGKTEAAEEDRLVAGREVTFLAIRKPVIDAAGNTLGLLCVLNDVTENKRQKAAQERRIHELEGALSERVGQVESLKNELERACAGHRQKEEEFGRLRGELESGLAGLKEDMRNASALFQQKEDEFNRLRAGLEAEVETGREDMHRLRNEMQKELYARDQAEAALKGAEEEARQKEEEFTRLRAELEAEIQTGREDLQRLRNELQREMHERGQAVEALKRSVSHAQELLDTVQKAAGNQ